MVEATWKGVSPRYGATVRSACHPIVATDEVRTPRSRRTKITTGQAIPGGDLVCGSASNVRLWIGPSWDEIIGLPTGPMRHDDRRNVQRDTGWPRIFSAPGNPLREEAWDSEVRGTGQREVPQKRKGRRSCALRPRLLNLAPASHWP